MYLTLAFRLRNSFEKSIPKDSHKRKKRKTFQRPEVNNKFGKLSCRCCTIFLMATISRAFLWTHKIDKFWKFKYRWALRLCSWYNKMSTKKRLWKLLKQEEIDQSIMSPSCDITLIMSQPFSVVLIACTRDSGLTWDSSARCSSPKIAFDASSEWCSAPAHDNRCTLPLALLEGTLSARIVAAALAWRLFWSRF